MKDYQREAVYRSEREAGIFDQTISFLEAHDFARKVARSKRAQALNLRAGEVILTKGKNGNFASYCSDTWTGHSIRLAPTFTTEKVVLHELCHAMVGNQWRHGPTFARTLLELWKIFLGKAEADRLRYAFLRNGVSTKGTMTPTRPRVITIRALPRSVRQAA